MLCFHMIFEPFKLANTVIDQALGVDGKTGHALAKSPYEWGMTKIIEPILGK